MAFSASSPLFSRPVRFSAGSKTWKQAGIVGSVVAGGLAAAFLGSYQKDPIRRLCASLASDQSLWNFLPLACLTSPLNPSSFTEPSTGVCFPSSIAGTQQLAGTGLRKKSIIGLKNITVYAFGVYADEASLKDKLGGKYTQQFAGDLQENKSFYDDVVASDFDLTVRLVIVYGRLKIGSVRSAFEDSIGSRIKKFNGSDDHPLLQSFTSAFKDDIKLPKGTIIDITRHHDHVLTTKIDGTEVGSVQSSLLCRSFMDLYMGEDPFDVKGREEIGSKLAAAVIN